MQVMYYTAQSLLPVGSSAGGYHIGYDKVIEVLEGPAGAESLGRTEYSFYNQTESIVAAVPGTPNFTHANTNGRTQSTELFDAGNYPVKSNYVDTTRVRFPAIKCIKAVRDTETKFFGTKLSWQVPYVREAAVYQIRPEFVAEKKVIENQYDLSSHLSISTQKEFFYESKNHFQLTRTVTQTSTNKQIVENYIYPSDYTLSASVAGIKYLQDNHLVSPVIEKYTIRQDANGTNAKVVSGILTLFHENMPYPKEVKELGINSPMNTDQAGKFTPSNATANGFVPSSRYQIQSTFALYTGKGNVKDFYKSADMHLVYLYGYKGSFPIAEIRNADWTTVQTALSQINLTEAQVEALNDATMIRAKMEELKSKLPGTMISYFTYDPLVGMTSQTGPEGITVYYEYDDAQRLLYIKDQALNIIKAFNYHYKGLPFMP